MSFECFPTFTLPHFGCKRLWQKSFSNPRDAVNFVYIIHFSVFSLIWHPKLSKISLSPRSPRFFDVKRDQAQLRFRTRGEFKFFEF